MTRCIAGLVAFVAAAPGVVWGQTFVGLGVAGSSQSSRANAISEDGTTVVGRSGFSVAWKWRASTGLVPFAQSPAGYTINTADDVSADGNVVVGNMSDGVNGFVWRSTDTDSPSQVAGLGGSAYLRVSSDGSTIVGSAPSAASNRVVRWTQGSGAVEFGFITGLPQNYFAWAQFGTGVSSDGSIIVGHSTLTAPPNDPANNAFQNFRWSESTGPVAVLNQGAIFNNGTVWDVSGDGQTSVLRQGASLYRWTLAGGYQLIRLGGSNQNEVPRISADASTVVDANVVWTQATGARSLETVLAEAGCDFTGWSGLRVTDVSGNGRALCGYGVNPLGQTEAWYASVPAPGGVVGLVVVGGVVGGRRRRVG